MISPEKAKEDDLCQLIQGMLVCSAAGDTLGMPVEGWKRAQIRKYVGRIEGLRDPVLVRDAGGSLVTHDEFGKLKYWTREFSKGEWTDDTILSYALCRSLIAEGYDLDEAARCHLREYTVRKRADGTVKGGFGGTTMDAFKRLEQGISPRESGVVGGPGNAPAMKMAPIGAYMAASGTPSQGLIFAQDVGLMTHLDPRSVASGVVQARLAYEILSGADRRGFLDAMLETCAQWEGPLQPHFALAQKGTLLERLQWVASNRDASPDEAHGYLNSTSVVFSSYPFALFMVQKHWDDPLRGLLETVNYGGDCDTTGAMFGALLGARHGEFVPAAWREVLQDYAMIKEEGARLYAAGLAARGDVTRDALR